MHGTLNQRIRRKIFGIIKKDVPFRKYLRPTSIISPEEVFKKYQSEGCVYKKLYTNVLTELQVEKKLFEKVAPYTIYDEYSELNEETVKITHKTDYCVLSIPNGRLYSNNNDNISIITSDNELVDHFSYQYHTEKKMSAAENKILKQQFFTKPQHIDGTLFSTLSGYGPTVNIAHWFFDSFSRIYLLKEAGLLDQVDYFLVPSFRFDYQKDSLNQLGIKDEQIIPAKEDVHYIAKNLVVASHPRGNRSFLLPKWISDFTKDTFLSSKSMKDINSPKKIYVSRKDSKLRQVINEKEVEEFLEKEGFTSVQMSHYSLLEKVKLFHNADIIISPSGAGLTSLFFCRENSNVVELFPEGFVHTHYYNMALHAGVNYYYMICKNENPSQNMIEGQLEDIYVDLYELDKILKNVSDKVSQ